MDKNEINVNRVNDRNFSKFASKWDEKPRRVQLAAAVAREIKDNVELDKKQNALEFGCGTALVSFNLVDQLGQITALDNAEGMLEVVKQKAQACGVDNIETCLNMAAVPQLPVEHYDLVYSSMVLHHLDDIGAVLRALTAALKVGGTIALADLDLEDGTFHADPTGVVHHGIDRDWLIKLLTELGFDNIYQSTAYTIVKQRSQGEMCYPVFFIRARKVVRAFQR